MAYFVPEGITAQPAILPLQAVNVALVQHDESFRGDKLTKNESAVVVSDAFPNEPEAKVVDQLLDIESGLERMLAPELGRSRLDLSFGNERQDFALARPCL